MRGTSWTFGGQAAMLLLQIVSISILARLLEPDDFGLIGLLASVIAVLALFREMGFGTAIVQSKEVSDAQLHCIFRITLALGIASGALTWLIGSAAAAFLHEPRLAKIAPWFGLCFVFNSLETVPLAILRRNLQFSRIVLRDFFVRLIALIVAIVAAWLGAGYWALVLQAVLTAILQLTLSWIASGWLPRIAPSSLSSVMPMLKFGAAFTGSNVANYLTQNLDTFLIGKIWGIDQVGFYTRARALMMAPVNQALGPLGTVMMPVLSRVKDQPAQMRVWIDRLSMFMLAGSGPTAAFMVVASEDIVNLMLGPGWEPVIPVFRWMSLYLIVAPLGMLLHTVVVSSGNPRLLLHWTWTGAILTIIAVLLSVKGGIEMVAAATVLTALLLRTMVAMIFAAKTGFFALHKMIIRYLLSLVHAAAWLITFWYFWQLPIIESLSIFLRCATGGIVLATALLLILGKTQVGRSALTTLLTKKQATL